jgi:hypothetical protein
MPTPSTIHVSSISIAVATPGDCPIVAILQDKRTFRYVVTGIMAWNYVSTTPVSFDIPAGDGAAMFLQALSGCDQPASGINVTVQYN